MKKIIAVILFLSVCVLPLISTVSALDSTETDPIENTDEIAGTVSILNTYSCEYDRDHGKMVLSGTVKHDALISYKQYRVEIYRVPPGSSYENVIASPSAKPLATAEIAARFEFGWDVSSVWDRLSRYAIVLCSPEGDRMLAAPPQYATNGVGSAYAQPDRAYFKGLSSSETSLAGNLEIGTVTVPVYLDRLLQNTSYGYMYQMGERTVYLNKDYIYELDRTVRTYSATGTRVYLQLLLSVGRNDLSVANGAQMGASYDMPNVYVEDVLAKICASAEFLAERFGSYQNGILSGVIVGNSVDEPMMNYCGSLSLERYAEMYSLYLLAVASCIRAYHPAADVVIPFGNTDVYTSEESFGGTYSPALLLEQILKNLEDGLADPFACSTMVLCHAEQESDTGLSPDRIEGYSSYLARLRSVFSCAPTHYAVRWDVPLDMGSTALCANYAYSYYRLFRDPSLSSFVVSFSACEASGSNRLTELKQVLRWIDTKEGLSVTSSLVSHFGKKTWDELIPDVFRTDYEAQIPLIAEVGSATNSPRTGSFSYFDFPGGHIEEWFAGSSCAGIKTEYGQEGKRVLRGTLTPVQGDAYGEILCLYDFPENFGHTPDLTFRMALAEESGDAGGLYQVMITMGNDRYRSVSQTILEGADIQSVNVSLKNFPAGQNVNYIKISIRQLEGEAKELSFRLYDVVGYSEHLSSEELADRIDADRRAIRNLEDTDEGPEVESRWWIVGILLFVVSVMIGIFACFRREDASEESEDEADL